MHLPAALALAAGQGGAEHRVAIDLADLGLDFQRVQVHQLDGTNAHLVAKLAATPTTGELVTAYVGYRPEHAKLDGGGIRFQFTGELVDGDGMIVEILAPGPDDGRADGGK